MLRRTTKDSVAAEDGWSNHARYPLRATTTESPPVKRSILI